MNTLTGYSKSTLTDKYVLTAAGGHLAIGNAANNIPLNNSTVNTNLNADLLDGHHASKFLWYGGNTNLGTNSPFDTVTTWATKENIGNGAKLLYNSNGTEYSILYSFRPDSYRYGTILKWGYGDTYLRIARYFNNTWKSSNWEKISAGYADNAGSATKLTSSAGNTTLPIYFSDGKPVACIPSSLFSNLSNDNNNLSITVAGLNRTLTINYANNAGSATYLPTSGITTETSITESGLRVYVGSGSGWTGSVTSMAYAGIVTLGTPSRGFQMWARRGTGNTGSLHFRVGNNDANAWESERIILDNMNWTSYINIPTVTNYYWANIPISATSNSKTSPTFNIAAATRFSGELGDSSMTIKAERNNEINFGGTNNSTTIYFGYRATGSKPIPTNFTFGSSTGTANIKANGFIKAGSDNTYVLLGGGSHKALSDFATSEHNHDNRYLMLINKAGSNIDLNKVGTPGNYSLRSDNTAQWPTANSPISSGAYKLFVLQNGYDGDSTTPKHRTLFAILASSTNMYIRYVDGNGTWSNWATMAHSANGAFYFTAFSGGVISSSGNTLSQTNHSITIGGQTRTAGASTTPIINSLSVSKLTSTPATNLTLAITVNGIASANKTLAELWSTYLNVQYCRDDSSPSNKGLWNTIKNGTTNPITNRVRFYTIYGTTTDLGAPVNGHGELLEICSYNSNHWQPLLWFGSGKTGRLYYRNKTYNDNSWGDWRTVAWTTDTAHTVKVNNSDSNSTYRMVWHSGDTLYSTDGIYCNPSSDILNAKAYTINGASSAGANYITGAAGKIYFGGNFHIDSLGSNKTYINYFTANDVYLVSGSSQGKVGIGTNSPSYKLHIAGDSYATGWSRASAGFYVEGKGVHYMSNNINGYGQIYLTGNEFNWGASSTDLYFNYRASANGTTVTSYIWNAGSSTTYANHTTGQIDARNHVLTTNNFGINSTSGGGRGISLYGGSDNVSVYGIAFNQTSNWGTHGYVTSDWATYFTMNNLNNRGWIFRRNGSGNVFSIDTSGLVYANGCINGNCFTSRVATGTQPYACTSTTLNTNLNADLLDSYHYSSFVPKSTYNYTNGATVITSVKLSSSKMLQFHITGNSYGNYGGLPIDTYVQCYAYTGKTFQHSPNMLNNGARIPYVTAFYYNGVVCLYIPSGGNYISLDVYCQDTMEGSGTNLVTSIVNQDLRSSGSYGLQINPNNSAMLTSNVASASKWATARTLSLTGSVTGSVSFDGSGNITLATTTNHSHSEYLPLAGGTMTGILNTNGQAGTWVSGMTSAAIQYNSLKAIDSNSFWKFYNMKSAGGHVVCYGGLGNNIGFYGYYSGRTANNYDWNFTVNATNGNWIATNSIYAAHFYENSDVRLKHNIELIHDSNNIPEIKLFDWKEDNSHSYGLIALELEEQGYSELVETKEDGYKSVNYSAALSLIIGKLQVKIRELEKEIENLKNQN